MESSAPHTELTEGMQFESPSKTLTDAHFLLFSGITGDVHPIHYDVEYAKQTRFGKPLAHGLLLMSMTAFGASNARERIEGFVFAEQGCSFIGPCVVGDTIQPKFVVEKIWSEGHRKFCKIATTLVNQRKEIVLRGFQIYRVLGHRPAS